MRTTLSSRVFRVAALAALATACLRAAAPALPARRHFTAAGTTLHGVAASPDLVVAVGEAGVILTSSDDVTWTRRDSGVTETLRAVAYSPERLAPFFAAVGDAIDNYGGNLFAVGDGGTIVTAFLEDNWRLLATPTTANLRGVGRINVSEVLAVGDGGIALLVSSGPGPYPLLDFGTPVALRAVIWPARYFAPRPPNWTALVVGDDGTFVAGQYGVGPLSFATYQSESRVGLRGVAASESAVVAVGDRGTIWWKDVGEIASGEWTALPTGTPDSFTAVTYRTKNESSSFYIVGENEEVWQIEDVHHAWLTNLALRGKVGNGNDAMILGFAIAGSDSKRVLLRAAGPALTNFGVSEPIANPTLTLFAADGTELERNAGWGSVRDPAALARAAQSVGAFAFSAGSTDSALLVTLPPGTYTAEVTGRAGDTGTALFEIYDADADEKPASRFTNLSARCRVGTGEDVAIPALQSRGNRNPRLLIRAVGPGLASFGVTDGITAASIEVIRPSFVGGTRASVTVYPPVTMAQNRGWDHPTTTFVESSLVFGSPTDIVRMAAAAGAFPLADGSPDAAILLSYRPSDLTLQVSSANGVTGTALIEVYDVSEK